MEYQKIVNLLDNTLNQLSKFRTKNWIEINDQSRGVYNTDSDIRFKTTMLKSSLCDESDAYMLVKGRKIIIEKGDLRNKVAISKSSAPFINWKNRINNTEIDNAKEIDIVLRMYNLVEYCDTYVKISGRVNKTFKNEAKEQKRDFLVCY